MHNDAVRWLVVRERGGVGRGHHLCASLSLWPPSCCTVSLNLVISTVVVSPLM